VVGRFGASRIPHSSLIADSFASVRLALRPEGSSVTFSTRPRRLFALTAKTLLIVSLLALVVAATSPAAQAKPKKTSCAEAIRNDWYGDGRIDKQYEVHCYRDAIRGLPLDVKDYQHASEDILRALAYRKQGKPDPGDGRARTPSKTDQDPSESRPPGIPPPAPDGSDGTSSVADGPDDLDGSSSSSIPIPLLVLGGLAIVLLGAGGGGYVSRRLQARRGGND
jgi:hypothetical protein